MFRHYWKKHHLRICLLSYRIIYVLLSITIIILCGEYYTYDAVGGEEYAICYRVDQKYYRFALSDNASSYSSKFEFAKIR